jgi:hypothetical protein
MQKRSHVRKVSYVLGAGFSYGTKHTAKRGNYKINMPLQVNLLEEIFKYHFRSSKSFDGIAKLIRTYFCPNRDRPSRDSGAYRHFDIMNLSVEEIVTFFEEMIRDLSNDDVELFRKAEAEIRRRTVELISFLSCEGSPSTNAILRAFRDKVMDTDTIITFNWDTLLDRALYNKDNKKKWHPAWGYGRTVRKIFQYAGGRKPYRAPKKHPTLFKLHGSVNWVARGTKFNIAKDFSPREQIDDVVMMPPKMLKREIWGEEPTEEKTNPLRGNWAVHDKHLYREIWREAESHLARSKQIVFIGYSFPAADTSVYGLLRRSLALAKNEHGIHPNVVIVDPNAAELAKRFKQSFQVEIPLENQFLSLSSYVLGQSRSSRLAN